MLDSELIRKTCELIKDTTEDIIKNKIIYSNECREKLIVELSLMLLINLTQDTNGMHQFMQFSAKEEQMKGYFLTLFL